MINDIQLDVLEENSLILKNFLRVYFFQYWVSLDDDATNPYNPEFSARSDERSSLVLCVTPVCNTKCTYCYYKNFSQYTYPQDIINDEKILDNCKKLFDWIKKEKFVIPQIEIFSGEFFKFKYYKEILSIINDYSQYIQTTLSYERRQTVIIPTNGTFCFDDISMQRVIESLDSYSNHLKFLVSFSVDGKYLDNDTRPLRNGKKYDDDYYQRIKSFCLYYKDKFFKNQDKNELVRVGFHPMISKEGINNWEKNFYWYLSFIKDIYGGDYRSRYSFLEVRNPDWDKDSLKKFFKAYKMWTEYSYKDIGNSFLPFSKFRSKPASVAFSNGKTSKLSCSYTYSLEIRLGDLAIIPCHRTAYPDLIAGYLNINKDSDMNIIPKNIFPYILGKSRNLNYEKKCSKCKINNLCPGNCMGSNYELNGDMFSCVSTVCDLEMTKLKAIIAMLLEKNLYTSTINLLVKNKCNIDKINQLNFVKDEYIKTMEEYI